MDAYLLDWLALLLRWAHVVAGIAWIGASFYVLRLGGEQQALKWQAYWTWFTGFALLVAVYYANAESHLLDPAVMLLTKWSAIGAGLAFIVGALVVYEGLCRSPLAKSDLRLGLGLAVFAALLAWSLSQVFSGRGAFMHYGAILGMIMVANVAHDKRSEHNTYLTLPVVFAMIAGHAPMTFGHPWSWLLLFSMTLAGALIRLGFVRRHQGRSPAPAWALGVACIGGAAALVMPQPKRTADAVPFETVNSIVQVRCAVCHAERPGFPGITEAPKGAKLETSGQIRALAAKIHQQTVATKAMPPNNITGMTEDERGKIDRWFRGGP